MVMLMPPYHGATLRADADRIVEHYAHVAEETGLPIIVQDAPLSGVTLPVSLLVRLAQDLPLVRSFKIEVPGTAEKLRALIEAGGDAIAAPFDGERDVLEDRLSGAILLAQIANDERAVHVIRHGLAPCR